MTGQKKICKFRENGIVPPPSQSIVNLFMDITTEGFGKPHNIFGILLFMLAWVMTTSNLGCNFFLVTMTLVHVSSKKMCLSRHS